MAAPLIFRTVLAAVACALPLGALAPANAAECLKHPSTLRAMRNCYRPVLVFTPSLDTPEFKAQMEEMQMHAHEFQQRDLLFVPIVPEGHNQPIPRSPLPTGTLSEDELAAARHRFKVSEDQFLVILLGKDGAEKLSGAAPVSMQKLFGVVDAMPMRQREAEEQREEGDAGGDDAT